MDVQILLERIASALARHRVEAVLIGNAAAAVHGAPVTTLDFDFMFRNTRTNRKKLRVMAQEMGADLYSPSALSSGMFRMQKNDYDLLIDFLSSIAGVRTFEGLRSRAKWVRVGESEVLVASLADIIKSKRAAGRPKDRAVLPILEQTLEEATTDQKRKA